MTQNIYDTAAFFEGYSRLPRSVLGLDGAPEWPDLMAMLPPMAGARALDLGCGFGWFCRWAQTQGARSVLGLDVSENMLARARDETKGEGVAYQRADLESADLGEAAFDLAYSSLALHYVVDLAGLFARIRRSLTPGGAFVFSVEHPVVTATTRQEFIRDADGRSFWPLTGYFHEGERRTDWLAKGVLKQHRRMDSYLNALLDAGFDLTRLIEWAPSPAQIAEKPQWSVELERPMFLLVSARARQRSP